MTHAMIPNVSKVASHNAMMHTHTHEYMIYHTCEYHTYSCTYVHKLSQLQRRVMTHTALDAIGPCVYLPHDCHHSSSRFHSSAVRPAMMRQCGQIVIQGCPAVLRATTSDEAHPTSSNEPCERCMRHVAS